MYAEWTYYESEEGFCGTLIKDKALYRRFAKKADNYIDQITGNKLIFAFPENDKTIEAIKDCACELTEILYRIDATKNNATLAAGYTADADGQLKGKIIKSVSSGSESVTYTGSENNIQTAELEAAKSVEAEQRYIFEAVRNYLAGKTDINGVNLMYAGPYPGKCAKWE